MLIHVVYCGFIFMRMSSIVDDCKQQQLEHGPHGISHGWHLEHPETAGAAWLRGLCMTCRNHEGFPSAGTMMT